VCLEMLKINCFRFESAMKVGPRQNKMPPHQGENSPLRRIGSFAGSIMILSSLFWSGGVAQAADDYRLLKIDGHLVKWGDAALGGGATLTYSVVDGPSGFSGTYNCRRITGIGKLLARSRTSRQVFDQELSAAFAMWEAAANLRFVAAKSVVSANILISAQSLPDGVAYADVTPASSQGQPISRITKGIVCLNPNLRWTAASRAAGGREDTNAPASGYRLRYTLAHEIGHVLGLDHPGPVGELMSFEYRPSIDTLQPGDVAGIAVLYGPRNADPVLALNSQVVSAR
jgi:hypothetical protein